MKALVASERKVYAKADYVHVRQGYALIVIYFPNTNNTILGDWANKSDGANDNCSNNKRKQIKT